VVHLAAVADPLFRPEPLLFANNTQATFTVLWTAAEAGVRRLVVAGSVNAIGLPFNPHRPLPRRYPLDETVVPDLADPYSLAKHVDEATLRAVCRRFGATGVVLRLPLMIPPGREREIVARSWEDAGRAAAEGWGWLSTTDGAEAFARALRVPVDGVRVVQLAARNNVLGVPTEDLLERYAPDVPHPPFVGREAPIDTRRAAALLGFEPRQADPLPAQG
jgi:nucleoside-diphosphate-sugar epimerase